MLSPILQCAYADDYVDPHAPKTYNTPVEVRFGFEKIKLPNNETMGMIGGSYLLQAMPSLYIGPAAYGAVTGQRGGFFTGGGEIAIRRPLLSGLDVEGGLYVGGGGGGSASVGGGLMLRPHLDLMWKFNQIRAGVSASQVRFPNGHIRSKQLGVSVSMESDFMFASQLAQGSTVSTSERGGVGFDHIAAIIGNYNPVSGVKDLNGKPYSGSLGYAGFRADQFVSESVYWGVESGAAVKGGADGYAEVLGLLGAEYPVIKDDFKIGSRVALGMGGGGRVPVGGGALVKAGLYAKAQVSRNMYVALEGGAVRALNGDFKSNYANIQLGLDLDVRSDRSISRMVQGMEWAASAQHYLHAARYNGGNHSLDLMGFKIDRYITTDTYMSAQAHSAFTGNAGGFSVGLLGLGARTATLATGLFAGAEMLIGAAGGGGVDAKGGATAQAMVYGGIDLYGKSRLKLGVGRVRSAKGALNSNAVDVTLSFPFGVPGK
ncbi:hypothetical protein LPB67_09010 [Undibacterium sp. Jales W-56]|uniref:hypothetical protein n=1 Tax=Undibacterium sp. Jales W-56 TaxID=2897325 RepID=UPI0021CE5DF3|nr:hypothetical protein [Undibacterium sp. Jales W-56]MCU6433914.1 hypothetical protein [Undibacterium sp. Jales W-56]